MRCSSSDINASALRGLLVALLVVVAASADATTLVKKRSLAEVTSAAGDIIEGRVVDVRSGRDDADAPATWVTVEVARTLKGRRARHRTFKQFGAAGRVPGMPQYRVGDQVVLFLHPESRRGFTSPVGMGQGVYRIYDDGARAVAVPEAGAPKTAKRQSLDQFLGQVEQLVSPQP